MVRKKIISLALLHLTRLTAGISASRASLVSAASVNLGLFAISLYPAWKVVQFISQRDEKGLNASAVEEDHGTPDGGSESGEKESA